MNKSLSDMELVSRLQKGDIEAFDQIYERYSRKLYYFALKYLRSTDESEELVQSVFLKVWENYKYLKRESSFNSYIFTIAYNDICKLFRTRYYWRKFADYSLAENNGSSANMEESIGYQAVLDRVQQIVSNLPEKQRAVFLRSRIEGKSTKEIARELKLSAGTVDNYISEVLKFIRNHIQDEDIAFLLFFSLFLH